MKPSESRRSFQWMLLSDIPWMAPDGMAFKKNYTNKQIKLKWTAAPSNNFFKILAGIIENYPYGNVCLCQTIMNQNACNLVHRISDRQLGTHKWAVVQTKGKTILLHGASSVIGG